LLFGWKPREYAPDGIDGFDVALTALFLHGWWPPAINSVVPGGWSIADEAMFYLVFPGLMLLARSLTRLIVTTVAAVVACRVLFLFALQHPPEGLSFPQSLWEPMVYLGFQNQAPNFLFGILAAAVLMKWPGAESQTTQRQWEGMFAVVLFAAMVLLFNFISNPLIAPTTIFSACAAGLCVLLHRSPTSILVNPVMARIGRVSFSMYILHFALLAPVFRLVITVLRMFMETRNDVVIMAVYYPLLVGVTFVAASVTFALIEAPFMALGRRLIARLRGEAGTASSMALQSRGLAD
jgi:exopolysaccharide production protein ExoZ